MSSAASPKQELKNLPSVTALFRGTFALLTHHAALYFGYAGWMLLPLIGMVFIRITLGTTPTSEQLIAIMSGVSLALNAWVYTNIATTTSSLVVHGKAIPTPLPFIIPFLVLLIYSLLVCIGLPLLLLPGIIFLTWFAYAPSVAILERGGFFASFIASKELVRGMFWQTFARLMGLFLPLIACYCALIIVLGFAYPHIFSLDQSTTIPLAVDVLLSLLEIVLMPVTVIYLTVLYLARKNG